jgi:hypothetical protein
MTAGTGVACRQPPGYAGLGSLLQLPLIRIPFVGGVVMILYPGFGLSPVISASLGSNKAWNFISLLEEDKE